VPRPDDAGALGPPDPIGTNDKPLRSSTLLPKGLILAGGIRSIGSTPRRAWSDRLPFVRLESVRIGALEFVKAYSRGQQPHDRCDDVEPSAHSAPTASRRSVSDRGLDRFRDRAAIVSLLPKSVNREDFPKEVTGWTLDVGR
jgi:hypothetical protein